MLNAIWFGLLVAGFLVASLMGRLEGETGVVSVAFKSAETAVIGLALPLGAKMMLFLGLMRIAEKAGLVQILARLIRPIMTRLFPDVPAEHPAMGSMILNMAANMLGLGNAATPLGLRAMQQLEELNRHKGTATNAMCTFLAINTSSVTLIPVSAIALLSAGGVPEPTRIIGSAILATLCSTTVAILAVKIFEKWPAFSVGRALEQAKKESASAKAETGTTGDPEEELPSEGRLSLSKKQWIGISVLGLVCVLVLACQLLPEQRQEVLDRTGLGEMIRVQEAAAAPPATHGEEADEQLPWWNWREVLDGISVTTVPLLFIVFLGFGAIRKVKLFEEFVEGAKEGFGVAVRIMPYLVAMLVAMAVFRDSGALMLVQWALAPVLNALGFPVELLPLALMRPLTGGGSIGIVADLANNPEVSESVKLMGATMLGSTETTLYVLAVYFGSVSIRRTRHALPAGLLADVAGIVAAVVISRALFG